MLELGGRPMVEWPLRALREAGLRPAVAAKRGTRLPGGVEVWLEPGEPVHPLAGIVTALRRHEGPVLVCACDMPFVTARLARWLAALPDRLALPAVGGRLHPLLGRYGPEVLPALEAALERRAPLTEAVAELAPRRITARELRRFGEPRLLLANVNTAADRAWAERELPSAIAEPLSR